MAGLDWMELDVDFHDDPKIRALCSRLRQPLADSYVSRLYAYCYKHVQDRFDPDVAPETIEGAANWKGRRGVLFDALHAVGVLEREAGKVVVHGVAARLAPHVARKLGNAIRQKRRRDKVAKLMEAAAGVTGDVTAAVTSDVTGDVTPAVTPLHGHGPNTDHVVLTNDVAPVAPIQPLGVHVQGNHPDLVAAVKRAAEAGVGVDIGKRAALWGEAEGLIKILGADAVHAAWVQAANKRDGDRGSVPLAYLVPVVRSLVKRGTGPPARTATVPASPPTAFTGGKRVFT
jgi:hypothetical protein